jgi:hypothetical protein
MTSENHIGLDVGLRLSSLRHSRANIRRYTYRAFEKSAVRYLSAGF